jgi:Ca2+-binding RTX toxin-like protein
MSQIFGTNGSDTRLGGADADTIDGATSLFGGAEADVGADSLNGAGGDDLIYGRAGADTLRGGAGYDYLFGGDGNDSLGDDADGGYWYGEAGNDTIAVTLGGAYLNTPYLGGGDGNDSLTLTGDGFGGITGAYVYGEAGNDTILAGGTSPGHVVSGGTGNDSLQGSAGADQINGDAGNDTVDGAAGADQLIGTGGRDSLAGGGDSDAINDGDVLGDAENPVFSTTTGHWYRWVNEPAGVTWAQAQAAAAATSFAGRAGYLATVTSVAEQALIAGLSIGGWIGASDAAVEGTWKWVTGPEAGTTFYVAGAGAQPGYSDFNPPYPQGGAAGAANDYLAIVYPGGFPVWTDFDSAYIGYGYYIEYGGLPGDVPGSLTAVGDTLAGGAGDDTLTAFGHGDVLDGGGGNDTAVLNLTNAPAPLVFVAPAAGVAATLPGGGSVVNVETYGITGTGFADSMIGGTGDDTLSGGGGNDTLRGGTGYDYLFGGDGNDSLADEANGGYWNGEAGNDTIAVTLGGTFIGYTPYAYGGEGNDSLTLSGDGFGGITGAYVYGDAGNDTILAGGTPPGHVVSGGTGNDSLQGSAGTDQINGDAGDDTVDGAAGADQLTGTGGRDSLAGGGDSDAINDGDVLGDAENPVFSTTTGHWYRLVYEPAGLTWAQAQAAAAATSFAGRTGYLATITSAAENALVGSLGIGGWIGASDAAVEGTWKWVTGPEAGTTFYVAGAGAQPGYSDFNPPYPQDGAAGAANDYLAIVYPGGFPVWTDFDVSYVGYHYYVEYGGLPGDVPGSLTAVGDTLAGGAGDDTLTAFGHGDVLDGGDGNDTAVINLTNAPAPLVFVAPASGLAATLPGGGSVLNVETYGITGTGFADSMIGGTGDDSLSGGGGNDTLRGGTGYDYVYGGEGNDSLADDANGGYWLGEAGNDTIAVTLGGTFIGYTPYAYGGEGNDSLTLSGDGFGGITGAYVYGDAGDDTILAGGTPPGHVVSGGEGNDSVQGSAGADQIYGEAGNDTVDGGAAEDILDGGDGNDLLVVDSLGDQVTDASGADTIQASLSWTLTAGFEALRLTGAASLSGTGTNNADRIEGNTGNNSLSGLNGGDTLDGGAGADTLSGGSGNDVFLVDSAGDVVIEASVAGAGADTVRASVSHSLGANVEALVLIGSAGNGTGNGGANTVQGSAGDNILDGGAGADSLVGGAGNDLYRVDATGDAILDSAGADTVAATLNWTLGSGLEALLLDGAASLNGTGNTLDNRIIGNVGANILAGLGGTDSLRGEGGADTLQGGDGADTVEGQAGDDRLDGGGDNDLVSFAGATAAILADLGAGFATGEGSDTLTGIENLLGSAQNDSLYGGVGSNRIEGGDGRDELDGGAGADTLVGGEGNDRYLVDDAGDVVQELGASAADEVVAALDWSLGANLERLTLDPGIPSALVGTGNALDNVVTGNDGANSLSGLGGADTLDGGIGADTLDGGAGADSLVGGAGNDLFIVGEADDAVSDSTGADTVQATISYSLGLGIEALALAGSAAYGTGNGGANTLLGNASDNNLDGGAGNDSLMGSEGSDALYGTVGDDTLDGGSGNDGLVGGTGKDSLAGGDGNDSVEDGDVIGDDDNPLVPANPAAPGDTLIGGAGNDTLRSAGLGDVLDGGAGSDIAAIDLGNAPSALIFEAPAQGVTATLVGGGSIANVERYGIRATEFADSVIASAGNDTVLTNGGDDTLRGGAGYDHLFGGSGNDSLTDASDGGNWYGEAGDDTIAATLNGSFLTRSDVYGGEGNDSLILDGDGFGSGSGAFVYGDDGDDTIVAGGTANHRVSGGAGDDSLAGGSGTHSLRGDAGDDTLDGGVGYSSLDGGDGNDVRVVDSLDDLFADASGADTIQSSLSWTLTAGFEALRLTGVASLSGTGTAAGDRITGNDGANSLAGLGGADTLEGGDANDTLDGGTGDDSMEGGAGDDLILVDDAGDLVTDSAGADTVAATIGTTLGAGIEALRLDGTGNLAGTGNALANLLLGNTGANSLSGLGDADTLSGGDGNDTLDGGAGADSLVGGAGNDSMAGGDGNDLFVVEQAGDLASDSAGADTVLASVSHSLGAGIEALLLTGAANLNGTGNTLANLLAGNTGANSLSGGDAADTLSGGDGNDTLAGGAGADSLAGGLGNDRYQVEAGDLATDAGGADTVTTGLAWTLGADFEALLLTGGSNIAGTGNALNNLLAGNTGSNALTGSSGNDTLQGNEGADTLAGGGQNDRLEGGGGADSLNGGTGADTLLGGLGNDLFVVDSVADVVTELAGTGSGVDLVTSSVSFTLGNDIENLTLTGTAANGGGNTLANVVTGNDVANLLTGGKGADRLVGNLGADTLRGGDGADTLNGGGGNDRMEGGAGNDRFSVDAAGDVVVELALSGTDLVVASVSYTLGLEVENLTLTGTAMIGVGNTLANIVTGNALANDLRGAAGNDQLIGSDGADSLAGGDGADTLTGGTGADSLRGGVGADHFVFGSASEGQDTIGDFIGGSDKLVFVGATFTGAAAAVANFVSQAGSGATTATGTPQLIYDTATGGLFLDADGGGVGAAVLLATLAGNPPLAAGDLLIG